MKNYFNIIISCILLLISFASVYNTTVDYEYETYIRITETEKIEEIDPREFQNEDELLKNMAIDYFNVQSKNDKIVGWLNVPNIAYYPVMAYSDNQFYLTHNEYDRYSGNGIPFMNIESNYTFKDISLVHAHCCKSGKMFGKLRYYKDTKFFQKNDLICVFDGEYFYYYKPFSVFLIKDGVEFLKQKSLNESERLSYFESIYERSMTKMEEEIVPDLTAQILYLQTCDYTFTDARLIVASYCVRTIAYDPIIHGPF